ncbi:LysR family transcriptional regulator [Streptacidiphilus sp. PB12-B1b]|uniref:LysR family transcriptional regulator n=1 Tax=Streptacidiphilus sp. PB12-B1b TaxID=2705012 RepID=UPI0015FA173A|nr:LysR family transcriptional regulator [Streptacidiphilus sp. PB12-B1b]QMU76739.1 LysR family transcriptional regulator [Streptacidiphilus sp. PB12-B1b]
MELRHLEHFLAVAETGSFTRAAERVHVVQSALSVSVRALEADLGAQLFHRSTRRVELTEAGTVLLGEARRTLEAARAAREAVAAVNDGMRGTIRVGIMHALPGIDLAAPLAQFLAERPLVQIKPTTNSAGSRDLVQAVADNRLDLALAAMPGAHPAEVEAIALYHEPIMLACPPNHPLAGRRQVRLADLVGRPFLDVPEGWGSRMSVDCLFTAHGLTRTIIVEVADVATVCELVRAGLGLALLAPSSAPADQRQLLVPVRPHATFTVSLVLPRHRTLSAAATAFADRIRATYGPAPRPADATG